jgi:hypothetical protein
LVIRAAIQQTRPGRPKGLSPLVVLPKTTFVNGYFRSNGTYVGSYYRSR